MNYKLVGFLRGLGLVVLVAVLKYTGDATHLSFIESPYIQGLVAAVILAIEHAIEEKNGKALFGLAKV